MSKKQPPSLAGRLVEVRAERQISTAWAAHFVGLMHEFDYRVLARCLAILCLALSAQSVLAADLAVQWARTFGTTATTDRSYGVAVAPNGDIVMTGEAAGDTGSDAYTVKYDNAGNLIWSRVYDTGNSERARGIAVDHAGSVYVSMLVDGPTAGTYNRNQTLVKYDPTGATIWVRSQNTLSGGQFSRVAVDAASNVFSTAEIEVTKWSPDGTVLWQKNTNIPAWGQYLLVRDIAIDLAGDAILTGSIQLNNGPLYYFGTVKLSGSNGALMWAKYDSTTGYCCGGGGSSLAVDTSGNVIASGNSGGYVPLLIKYSPLGDVLWTTAGSGGTGTGVAVDGQANSYVVGYGPSSFVKKYNPGGALQWTSASYNPTFRNVAIDANGSLYVSGATGSNENFWLLKLVPAISDLHLSKTASPAAGTVGSNLTYSLVVTNNGPAPATTVVVTDQLPPGVTLISKSVTRGQGSCSGTSLITCTFTKIEHADYAAASIVVRPAGGGSLTNTASATANEADPDPSNNSATVVTPVTGTADISVQKTASVIQPRISKGTSDWRMCDTGA